MLEPLPRSFYDRPVVQVARDLLGKLLLREAPEGMVAGRIVEVEAYQGFDDPAAHSFRGRTPRNATMFGPAGHLYVYSIHARFCMNVVTEAEGTPTAVLLRAVEPREGIELMQTRRDLEKVRDLARGPARLCEAYAIDRAWDGWDLTGGEGLWIAQSDDAEDASPKIFTSPRIGVTSAHESLLRFVIAGSPFVSGPRRLAGEAE